MDDKTIQDVVFGRVALPEEATFDTSEHRVEAWSGNRRLASASTDKLGRFRLDLKRAERGAPVDLRVFAPWGTEIERRALSPVELAAPRELLLRAALPPDILSPDGTGVPVPRVVRLVSQADMDVFHAVTAVAAFGDHFPQAGGPLGEVDRIYEILGELEGIYHWAYGALRGDPRQIRSIKLHLEQEHCFATGHHDAPNEKPDVETARDYLSIEDSDALPLAGVLLDSMDAEAKEHTWAERAQCYYLSRAAVIQRVFGAAKSVAEGAMDPEVFAAVLKVAAARPAHAEAESHDEAKLTVPVEQWDDATIRWAWHAERIQAIAKEKIRARDIPPLIDRVDPAAVAEGHAAKLTLFPAANSRFPKRPNGKLDGVLAYWQGGKRHLLAISRWTDSAIEVKLPSKLPAGRGVIYWEAPSPPLAHRIPKPSPEPPNDERVQPPSDQRVPAPYCVPGQIELPVLIPFVTLEPIESGDAEVGSRSVNFPDASGPHWELENFLRAESCTEVRLRWEGGVRLSAEPITRGAVPASVRVNTTILANGEVLPATGPAGNEIVADPRVSTRYEVRVEAHVGTVSLGTRSAAFSVDRYAQIRLEVADRVHPLDRPVPITVRLSCPAPAGLRVRLTSADTTLLTSNTFPMPAGHTEYTTATDLTPAGGTGAVLVTANADGHEPGTAFVHLDNTSCVPLAPRFGGQWEVVPVAFNDPNLVDVVGVHIAVLHTGKVLLFNYDEGPFPIVDGERPPNQWLLDILNAVDSDMAECRLWDPVTGVVTTVPLHRNLFCSGHAFLPDGQLFIASGQFHVPVFQILALLALSAPAVAGAVAPISSHLASLIPMLTALAGDVAASHNYGGADKDLHLFRPSDSTFSRLHPDMVAGRWYPTCVTLPSGKVMVISGTSGALARPIFGGIQDTFEIFDPMRPEERDLRQLGFHIRHLYPFMHVLPSGNVFVHYMRRTALFDPRPGGGFTHLRSGSLPLVTHYEKSRTGPGPGTSVLLPLLPTRDSSSGVVSYPAGRILILGGGGEEGTPEPLEDGPHPLIGLDPRYPLQAMTPATARAEIIDFSAASPVWEEIAPMRNARVMPDSVLLPNGKVLVVNGTRNGMAGAYGGHLGMLGPPRYPVLEPELFDPHTETWETLCSMTIPRGYHATAALLPDARVLVAGNDGLLNNYPGLHQSMYRLQVFSPPYLFRGPRPVILAAPTAPVRYGDSFQIEMGTDIGEVESVCLIRQSSVTHQINTDQRYVGLAIIPTMSRTTVTVQAPPNANIAPPGWYMLFVVNRRGVPSIARWVQILWP